MNFRQCLAAIIVYTACVTSTACVISTDQKDTLKKRNENAVSIHQKSTPKNGDSSKPSTVPNTNMKSFLKELEENEAREKYGVTPRESKLLMAAVLFVFTDMFLVLVLIYVNYVFFMHPSIWPVDPINQAAFAMSPFVGLWGLRTAARNCAVLIAASTHVQTDHPDESTDVIEQEKIETDTIKKEKPKARVSVDHHSSSKLRKNKKRTKVQKQQAHGDSQNQTFSDKTMPYVREIISSVTIATFSSMLCFLLGGSQYHGIPNEDFDVYIAGILAGFLLTFVTFRTLMPVPDQKPISEVFEKAASDSFPLEEDINMILQRLFA